MLRLHVKELRVTGVIDHTTAERVTHVNSARHLDTKHRRAGGELHGVQVETDVRFIGARLPGADHENVVATHRYCTGGPVTADRPTRAGRTPNPGVGGEGGNTRYDEAQEPANDHLRCYRFV